MIPKVKGIRRLGAAAYDLCLVAAGVYDGYWELRLGKWDMAAGYLMILEAGGICEFTEDDGKYNLVAGATDICDQIKKSVNLTN
jgi:myo-inositol-1(or 4)-monophosphatase